MASAIVSSLLEQLASSFIGEQAVQEMKQVQGVEEAVRKLESNLGAIQSVLEDAERRQVKEASVKQWLYKLKDVSYDLDDVLDEWNTAILEKQIKGEKNAPNKKRKVWSKLLNFYSGQVAHGNIVVKIKELNERLDVIAIEKRNFNFTLMGGKEELERQKYGSVIDVSKVHGRDQDKSTIIDKLLSEGSQALTLRIISIVGMGGIGKTTLAQLVFNDDKVKAHFQNTIWVCVSDPFDEFRIAKVILEALQSKTPNVNELENLFEHIHQFIKGKKFLLVLDDVWTEDYRKFEQLNNSLNSASPGSRILVTTRKETVAKIIGTTDDDMLRLGQLPSEECWSLFSQMAFFGRNNEESKMLEDIGRGIADKCKGLPLQQRLWGVSYAPKTLKKSGRMSWIVRYGN